MTQDYRPAVAYAAVSSAVAQNASGGAYGQQFFHNRIAAKLGTQLGTLQYGTLKLFNTTEVHLLTSDAIWAAVIAAGVNVSDAQYNSSTNAGTLVATSQQMTFPNLGLHKQIVFCTGDSITNSAVGATSYPEFNLIPNKLWYQGIDAVLPARYYFAGDLPVTAPSPPDVAMTFKTADARSRMIFNFGRDSGRLANIATYTYTQGFNWIDNIEQQDGLVLASGQQLVNRIFCGTNDLSYATTNGNPGLAAVPTGTPGAVSAGSPNYITNCLIPYLAAFKAIYPTAKIFYVTPICRSFGLINQQFNDIANYVIANKVALGIDLVLDTRQISQVSCTADTNSANTLYYQSDRVHPTPLTDKTILGPYMPVGYDYLLGYPIPGGMTAAFA